MLQEDAPDPDRFLPPALIRIDERNTEVTKKVTSAAEVAVAVRIGTKNDTKSVLAPVPGAAAATRDSIATKQLFTVISIFNCGEKKRNY